MALLRLTEHWASGVREAAAAALGAWARAAPRDEDEREGVRTRLVAHAAALLGAIEREPVPPGLTRADVCGAAQVCAHDNDPAVHTHQRTFACCSLDEHCDDDDDDHDDHDGHGHHATGEGQPWQLATGGVYLAREALRLWPDARTVDALLPLVDAVYRARWYPHYEDAVGTAAQQMRAVLPALPAPLLARPAVAALAIVRDTQSQHK